MLRERLRDDGIDNYGYDKSRKPGLMGVGNAQRGVFFSEDHAPGGKKKMKQGHELSYQEKAKQAHLAHAAREVFAQQRSREARADGLLYGGGDGGGHRERWQDPRQQLARDRKR